MPARPSPRPPRPFRSRTGSWLSAPGRVFTSGNTERARTRAAWSCTWQIESAAAAARRSSAWGAVLDPHHQPEPRPSVVYGAHLVVDQSTRQSMFAHHVFAHVGLQSRGALGPSDPEATVWVERLLEFRQRARELRLGRKEAHQHLVGSLRTP